VLQCVAAFCGALQCDEDYQHAIATALAASTAMDENDLGSDAAGASTTGASAFPSWAGLMANRSTQLWMFALRYFAWCS